MRGSARLELPGVEREGEESGFVDVEDMPGLDVATVVAASMHDLPLTDAGS